MISIKEKTGLFEQTIPFFVNSMFRRNISLVEIMFSSLFYVP